MNFSNFIHIVRRMKSSVILHLHTLGFKHLTDIDKFRSSLTHKLTTVEHDWIMFLCLDTALYNAKPEQ